jgi:GTP cyclohydrolase II
MSGLFNRAGLTIVNILPIEMDASQWLCIAFEEEGVDMGDAMHLAFLWSNDLVLGDNLVTVADNIFSKKASIPILRIHSECLLGDALHSDLCDCGEQLKESFSMIKGNGSGAILYLRQEGRGIGLRAKLACLAVQEGYANGKKTQEPLSSDDANLFFGFKVDERHYDMVTKFLEAFSITDVKMMTGNFKKIEAVQNAAVKIHGITDINRDHIRGESRKHRELIEKSKRHYNYILG